MISLKNLNLNKDQDSNKIFKDIKDFIDEYIDQKFNIDFFKKFSILFKIPEDKVKHKLKRLVYNDFDSKKCKFKEHNSIAEIIFDFFIILSTSFLIFIFGKQKFRIKEFDLIFDDIDSARQVKKLIKLSNKFKNNIFLLNNNKISEELKIKNLNYKVKKFIIPSKKFFKGNFFNIIIFFSKLFVNCISKKENFLHYYKKVYFSVIKNESLFINFKSKYLLIDRFYLSCPIKNYMFKKYCGGKVICCQYHLAESGISFFTDMDILFTFGNEINTKKKLQLFGGNIRLSSPIGSLSMEKEYFNDNKNLNKIEEIDVLIIGINTVHWMDVSNKIYENYYLYLKWVNQFSNENPNLRIVYKHHASFKGDILEDEILKNTRIQIISKDLSHNSYKYLEKSKIAISYGSTMILEGLSLNKNCFFVDPNEAATTFYSHLELDKSLFLNDYVTFKKTLLDRLNSSKHNIQSNEKTCLSSNMVSERIHNNLVNLDK